MRTEKEEGWNEDKKGSFGGGGGNVGRLSIWRKDGRQNKSTQSARRR